MIVGIDPGLKGAIAILSDNKVELHAMPVREVSSGRTEVDSGALYDLLYQYKKPDLCVIEQVGARPAFGASRAFTFGKAVGCATAVLELLEWPVYKIIPQVWQKVMLEGTDKSKAASVARVNGLYPHLKLGKDDHDKAEAVLLALYGKEKFLK